MGQFTFRYKKHKQSQYNAEEVSFVRKILQIIHLSSPIPT
jgi:hypothetical protein